MIHNTESAVTIKSSKAIEEQGRLIPRNSKRPKLLRLVKCANLKVNLISRTKIPRGAKRKRRRARLTSTTLTISVNRYLFRKPKIKVRLK
jgi:hypothetical protein